MTRAIAWWLSAPVSAPVAVLLCVGVWLATAITLCSLPPPTR